jgi:hypothetical protein
VIFSSSYDLISLTVAAHATAAHHHCATIVLLAAIDLGLWVLWIMEGVLR